MSIFSFTIVSLWVAPILAYILLVLSRNRSRIRNGLLLFFGIISIIEIIFISTDSSFVSTKVDFIFTSIFYLGICFGIWVLCFKNKKPIKIIGIILAVLIFGINYFSGTVGALGVGFILYKWESSQEVELTENLVYKETSLGMALDDFRGKRIEIYRTSNILPLETKIMDTSYYEGIPWSVKKLDLVFNKEKRELYLAGIGTIDNEEVKYWKDTINIK